MSTMVEQDILVRFGERMRELRKERGWSQEELAIESGMDRSYVGGVERGERNVALRNIELIAITLELSISELMEDI